MDVQARAIASSVERQYHRHAVEEALASWLVNATVLNRIRRLATRLATIAEPRSGVKYQSKIVPISP